MTDILEIIVAWDAGEGISQIARRLGYTRVTVRKYAEAARALGVARGGGRRSEAEWVRLAQAVVDRVAARRAPGAVAAEVARHHAYLEARVGRVHLSVLHQRLRDEQGLAASWGVFYRYVAQHWPDRLLRAPRVTVRREDPPPGEEAQVDFCYVGLGYGASGHLLGLNPILKCPLPRGNPTVARGDLVPAERCATQIVHG